MLLANVLLSNCEAVLFAEHIFNDPTFIDCVKVGALQLRGACARENWGISGKNKNSVHFRSQIVSSSDFGILKGHFGYEFGHIS